MSLVEQAIARLKNSVSADRTGAPERIASKLSTPPGFIDAAGATPKVTKQMTIDTNALRAEGYLPEESRDRHFSDHYRRIKRPLVEKALSGKPGGTLQPRLIMVTSALPGDGKTFTSINLALSMALERDISLLLVDADAPKPHVTEILGLQREPGLLDAVVDDTLDVESLIIQTNLQGLSILPAGTPMHGTAELLSSNRMRQLMTHLCTRNPRRIVLLDSPPLLITNEGRALVKIAGQVVVVVRAGETPQQAVQDAIGLIDEHQAGGLVLNQVQVGLEKYYGYGGYGIDADAL
jgi:exopolysaccharide/PEP-CTERM locus tyrosine autokinase